jgi:hypothetical protein
VSDVELEQRVTAALRGDVPGSAAHRRDVPMAASAKARIMERVRETARETAREMPRRPAPAFGRGARHSIVGLALAAGVGSVTTLSALLPPGGASGAARTAVIGDTVVATLRDTLRLVRLMFDDPGAREVAVVGDFNGWRAGSTPLARDGATRRWSATLALRDGAHRYAFVVDGTRWVPDPAAERVQADDGRVYSLLHVARTTN